MTTIEVVANDQELVVVKKPLLAAGDLETVKLHAAFSSEWDGYVKTAVFWQSEENVYHVLLDSENECTVPWEVLKTEGFAFFGIFGVKDGIRKTSAVVKYRIKKGAWTPATTVPDPTPDIYTQLLTRLYGVHIGSEEPTDPNILVWIDPDGDAYSSVIESIEIELVGAVDEDGSSCGCNCSGNGSSITDVTITEV